MSESFVAQIHAYRDDLLRIARLQLRDADTAEDVVQETLLAALRSQASFAGRAKLKSWLIGILKFKIIDALRRRARGPIPASDLAAEADDTDPRPWFDRDGVWQHKPVAWHEPYTRAHEADFLRVLEACLTKVPPNAARVFMLRELLGLETDEICGLLSVSKSNLGVLLYRARLSLRGCLELNWLDGELLLEG